MKQYESLRFFADAAGQARKIAALNYLARKGWRVIAETAVPGHVALLHRCLGFFYPAALLARSRDTTVVTIERDAPTDSLSVAHEHHWEIFDDDRAMCSNCETIIERRDSPLSRLEGRAPLVLFGPNPKIGRGKIARCDGCGRPGYVQQFLSQWLHDSCAKKAGLL